MPAGAFHGVHDGGDLRHSNASHHAGGADGTRTDACLDCISTSVNKGARTISGSNVSSDHFNLESLLNFADRTHDIQAMTVSSINHNHVNFSCNQALHAIKLHDAHRSANTEPPARVATCL